MVSDVVRGVDHLSSLFVLNPSNRLEKKEERERKKEKGKKEDLGKKEVDGGDGKHLVDRKA